MAKTNNAGGQPPAAAASAGSAPAQPENQTGTTQVEKPEETEAAKNPQPGDTPANPPAGQVDQKSVAEEAAKIAAQTLAAAEAAKNPQPGPVVQAAMAAARRPPMSAAERLAGEETVTMVFPRKVLLTLSDHSRVEFPAGTQEVPVSLKDHSYLKLNGVTEYVK